MSRDYHSFLTNLLVRQLNQILGHHQRFCHINGKQNSDDKTLTTSIIRLLNIVQRAAWPGFAVPLVTKTEQAVTRI